jgi:hypothetical protein
MDLPAADAGMDKRVTLEGSEVLLDASGSSGENLTYRWIENGTLLSEEPVFGHLFTLRRIPGPAESLVSTQQRLSYYWRSLVSPSFSCAENRHSRNHLTDRSPDR